MDLSIIIPLFNAEKTLPATLNSVFLQEKGDFSFEVIAVDDGSTDNSESVLAQFDEKAREAGIAFSWKRYENGGVGKNRNRGLGLARGESVLFLDADDLLLPGAIKRAMEVKKETGADILLFDSQFLFADGSVAPFPLSRHPGGEMTVADYMLSEPCPWNKILPRRLFEENDLFFEEGILYEDLALIPALGSFVGVGKIYYLKECLHSYFQSENSIMRSGWSERRLDIFPALEALKKNTRGQREALEAIFFSHLYRGAVWLFWEAGKIDAIRRAVRLMKQEFPHWRKNKYVLNTTTKKERCVARIFEKEMFWLIRLWKGGKK